MEFSYKCTRYAQDRVDFEGEIYNDKGVQVASFFQQGLVRFENGALLESQIVECTQIIDRYIIYIVIHVIFIETTIVDSYIDELLHLVSYVYCICYFCLGLARAIIVRKKNLNKTYHEVETVVLFF